MHPHSSTCPAGTSLATPAGDRLVETLGIGDRVCLADGGTALVQWIGRMRLSAAELAARPAFWPVLVRKCALADGIPARDLAVMPDQDLAPPGFGPTAARWLVNAACILRAPPPAPLDLFTVEVEGGGNLLAEGLALRPAPSAPPGDTELFALRRHVANRNGLRHGPLRGSLDGATRTRLDGWVLDPDRPDRPVVVEVTVNGSPRQLCTADRARRDLAAAGIGTGLHGFQIVLDPPLDPAVHHLVRLRRAGDGAELRNSPVLLAPEGGLEVVLAEIDAENPVTEDLATAARFVAARLA